MTQGTVQEQVLGRAIKDAAFRQALLNDPRAVLAQEYQFHLPDHIVLRVIEEAPNTLTLVLPARQEEARELTDAELEAVAGAGVPQWDTFTRECRQN